MLSILVEILLDLNFSVSASSCVVILRPTAVVLYPGVKIP